MEEKKKTLDWNHKRMLLRRSMDPKNYEFVKETYASLYVRDIRTGLIKILHKKN